MSGFGLISLFADGFNGEFFADFFNKLLFAHAVQIFYDTVIVHDFKLVAGKENRKEIIEFLIARVVRELLSAL